MEQVENWVRNIVCYLIFLTLICNLLPSGKYEKYVRLFGGMVLILVVIQPFTSSLQLDEKIAYYFETFSFQEEMSGLKEELGEMDRQRAETITKEYEQAAASDVERMAKEAGFSPVSVEVDIDSDQESETFGMVVKVSLVVEGENGTGEDDGEETYGEEKESRAEQAVEVAVEQVEPVKIQTEESETDEEEESEGIFLELASEIADYYELEESHVEIQMEHE